MYQAYSRQRRKIPRKERTLISVSVTPHYSMLVPDEYCTAILNHGDGGLEHYGRVEAL